MKKACGNTGNSMFEDHRMPSEFEMEEWIEENEITMTFKQWIETGIIYWLEHV